jgi:hypothetical protein
MDKVPIKDLSTEGSSQKDEDRQVPGGGMVMPIEDGLERLEERSVVWGTIGFVE